MPLDGITTHFLSRELHSALQGARIDKIYQPDSYELLIHVRQDSKNLRLLLSANPAAPRLHFTEISRENPALPSAFCMLLRKHLVGGRVLSVSSPCYERIIEITVGTVDELNDINEKRLIIEMMGRYSNVILLNAQNRILDSLLHVDARMSRVREIQPARPYSYPPVQSKFPPLAALDYIHRGELPILPEAMGRPLEKALQESLLGFSPVLAREICYLSGVDPRTGVRQLKPDESAAVERSAEQIIQRILREDPCPTAYSEEPGGVATDYHAFLLHEAGCPIPYTSISSAMDAVYRERDKSFDFEQKRRDLLLRLRSSLDHATRRKTVHQGDIDACADRETLKEWGRLILAESYRIPDAASSFIATNYEEEPPSEWQIPLDPTLTPAENAQVLFKRYAKMKGKYGAAVGFLEEDERAIEYLSSLCFAVENATEPLDLQAIREEMESSFTLSSTSGHKGAARDKDIGKYFPGKAKSGNQGSRALRAAGKASQRKNSVGNQKAKKAADSLKQTFRNYRSSDGYEILCGRNNVQNDQLTLKTAAQTDLWFHVQKMPGTHVILRTQGKDASENAILEAAQTAAFFSRTVTRSAQGKPGTSSDYSGLKIAVDYCPVKNVKKPSGAKPGMVVYDHYKTVLVSPSEPSKEA